MSTGKWGSPESLTNGLTTELNSLTDGSYTAASSAIDNATDLYLYLSAELNVTYGTNPSAGGYVALYLVTSLDGTSYEDGGGSTAPAATRLLGTWPLRATTSAQKIHLTNLLIPPYKFKLIALNKAGQTMASSGNTVKYARHNEQVV